MHACVCKDLSNSISIGVTTIQNYYEVVTFFKTNFIKMGVSKFNNVQQKCNLWPCNDEIRNSVIHTWR